MELLIIFALTVVNGFFSGAEIALLSVRKTRLQELASEGHSSARAALALRREPESFLATVQVGITVVGATAAAFGGTTLTEPVARWLQALGIQAAADRLALALVVSFISVLSVVLGELVPKSISLRSSERISLFAARPLLLLSRVARPLVWLLSACSNLLLKPFNDQTSFVEGRLSPDELQQLVEEAAESGALHEDASEIASRAIDLASVHIGVLTIPRVSMVWLKRSMSRDEVWQTLKEKPHARYPILSEDSLGVDGYVTARDVILQLVEQGGVNLEKILREVPYFSERTSAIDVLRSLQRGQHQLGVVVDEYGSPAGIVTAGDIMEDLVGDVLAEHEHPNEHLTDKGDGVWLVQASVPVHELNRELGLDLPLKPSYATLAGLIIDLAGRIMKSGDEIMLPGNVRAIVREATMRQIRAVELTLPREHEGANETVT